ncbi:MAG: fasciclin domain-containing protein [Salinibacter sp.]
MKDFLSRISLVVAGLALLVGPVFGQQSDMAEKSPDLVDTAVQSDNLNTLVKALKAADLAGALKGEGPFTVFAPTDAAFEALPDGQLKALLKPENKAQLQSILKYHVVRGTAMASDVVKMKGAESLEGRSVQFQVKDGTVRLMGQNTATVVQADVEAANGVIHVIDTVLLPPEPKMDETSSESGYR